VGLGFLGATLGKFTGALGGAPVAGGVIVTGLVVGAIAGASAGGAFTGPTPSASPAEAAVYPCPNMGPELITVKSGQRVLVIGKSADGQWFEILYPSGALKSAWVQAPAYALIGDASTEDVPITECDPATVTAFAVAPAESMSDVGSFEPTPPPTPTPTPKLTPTPTPPPTPTPRPGSTPRITPRPPTPPPTAPPTAPPDRTAPKVGTPQAFPNPAVPDPCGSGTTNVRVTASDAESGIKSVRLTVLDVTGAVKFTRAMSLSNGQWRASLSIKDDGLLSGSVYPMYAIATNNAGLKKQGATGRFSVAHCVE
jgi:hypothetical protein